MSPRLNWDPPTLSPARECAPPPVNKGGTHSPAGDGVGEPKFQRLEKRLSPLSTLCTSRSEFNIYILAKFGEICLVQVSEVVL